MFLIPLLPLWTERDAPMHGITQEHLRLPLPWLSPSRLTQRLCASPKTGSSITASCTWVHFSSIFTPLGSPGHSATWSWLRASYHPSPPSLSPIPKSLKTNFQGRQESLEVPCGPQVERQSGKRERWAVAGKRWSGRRIWRLGRGGLWGKGLFPIHAKLQRAFPFH